MATAVEKLIVKAEKFKKNEKVALSLVALLALENATHSNVEYKKLKVAIETAEAGEDDADEKTFVEAVVEALETFGEDKDKLEEHGKKFGIDLDKRNSIETMHEELVAHVAMGDQKNTENVETVKVTKEVKALVEKVVEKDEDGVIDTSKTLKNLEDELGLVEKVEEKPKKKLSMANIKMIGSKFYSKKDRYRTGFATATECAEKFNK